MDPKRPLMLTSESWSDMESRATRIKSQKKSMVGGTPENKQRIAHGAVMKELLSKKPELKREALVTAMPRASHSDHDHLTLLRSKGQSAHEFTDFMVETRRALHTIDSRPQGKKLLTELNAGQNVSRFDNHSTVIIEDARRKKKTGNTAGPEPDQFGLSIDAYRLSTERSSERGKGTSSLVAYNPDTVTPKTETGVTDGSRPAFIGLAHELVHSYRQQKGLAVDPFMPLDRTAEEMETVGMVDAPQKITENSIRKEHGIAKRTTYGGVGVEKFEEGLTEMGMKEDY